MVKLGPPWPSVSRQPLPVANGSPHWSTLNEASLTSRWHFELSQNFLLARSSKAAAVHGTLERSTDALITPRLVSMVSTSLPVLGTVAGGRPTSLTLPPPAAAGVKVQATWPAGTL